MKFFNFSQFFFISFTQRLQQPTLKNKTFFKLFSFHFVFRRPITQITLESFTLGRFMSYTLDGCPDGYLQIAEASRAPVGGMWCGTSWGPVVFYSETRTLILTVKLFK